MSLSNVFLCCKCMEKFREFQIFERKKLTKSRFFRGRDENWTSWCRGFVCPSTRLCLEESSFKSSSASNATLIFDIRSIIRPYTRFYIRPIFYFRHLHTTYSFTLFISITSFRARGGLKGGSYIRGLRGERRGGEKGWGRGIGSSCTSNRGFRCHV